MDNALLASFFASFSSEQSAFADAGHGRNLLVGMVFQELQGVVDLCRLELFRAAFTIIRVLAGNCFPFLGTLNDHVPLELSERQKNIPEQSADAVIAENAEIQYINRDPFVDEIGDQIGGLGDGAGKAV